MRASRGSADVAFGIAVVLAGVALGWAIEQRATGAMTSTRFFALTVAVPAVLVAILRPAWPLLVVIMVPPGVVDRLGYADTRPLIAVLLVVLLIHHQQRRSLFVGGGIPALSLAFLCVISLMDRAQVAPIATAEASDTRNQLILYMVVLVSGYALTRTGALTVTQLGSAFVGSALITFVILIFQVHGSLNHLRLNASGAPSDPGFDFQRTHFAYLMAAAFGLSLAGYLTARRHRGAWLAVSGVLGLGVAISFGRGGWLTASIMLVVLPWLAGRRSYWLLLPIPVILVAAISAVRERLFSDVSGGLQASISSGQIGTNRLLLWRHLWHRAVDLPWGHGFGYMWSLTPQSLGFGNEFQSTTNAFIYAHNDFLYWTIDLGLIGLFAWGILWIAALHRVISELRSVDVRRFRPAMLVLGPTVAMFVASLLDNGFFLPDVATPFFALWGALLANGWHVRHAEE